MVLFRVQWNSTHLNRTHALHRLSFSLISDTQGYRLTEAGAVPGDHAYSATPRVQAAATLIVPRLSGFLPWRSNPHRRAWLASISPADDWSCTVECRRSASGFARWQPPPPSSSLSRRAGRQPSWREWGSRCFFAPPEGSRLHLALPERGARGGTCLHQLGGGDCHSDGTIRW